MFDIEGGSLALEGLTITGGRADRGGGMLNDGGTLALDHVVLRGNRARVGGGLYNNGAAALTDVVIRGNTARVGLRPVQHPQSDPHPAQPFASCVHGSDPLR